MIRNPHQDLLFWWENHLYAGHPKTNYSDHIYFRSRIYKSFYECIKKILWLKNILIELINYNKTVILYTDNLASKKSIENRDLIQN